MNRSYPRLYKEKSDGRRGEKRDASYFRQDIGFQRFCDGKVF